MKKKISKAEQVRVRLNKYGWITRNWALGKRITRLAVWYLKRSLKKDEGYYISWQSNIAMAFKDNFYYCKKKYKSQRDVHNIANDAAVYFLSNLRR